jgi:hypothetical protein
MVSFPATVRFDSETNDDTARGTGLFPLKRIALIAIAKIYARRVLGHKINIENHLVSGLQP